MDVLNSSQCVWYGQKILDLKLYQEFDPHDKFYSKEHIVEENNSSDRGILSWATQSYTHEEAYFLFYGSSYNPQTNYIKMHGRKIYEFALNHVPLAMKAALEKSKVDINKVKKILIQS